jgi:hypothetical protein
MTTILLAVPLFMLAVLGLALGVVLGRRSIKGSCGGCANCIDKRDQT